MAQEVYLLCSGDTLVKPDDQTVLLQAFQHGQDVAQVFLLGPGKDQDVVYVANIER